jgi:hypothetical protein
MFFPIEAVELGSRKAFGFPEDGPNTGIFETGGLNGFSGGKDIYLCALFLHLIKALII